MGVLYEEIVFDFRMLYRECEIRYNVAKRAVMAELADAQDLGSCAARRVGSSPTNRSLTIRIIEVGFEPDLNGWFGFADTGNVQGIY